MSTSEKKDPNADDVRKRLAELLEDSRFNSDFTEEQRSELNTALRSSEENRTFASQYLLDSESLKEALATDEISAISTGKSTGRITDTREAGMLRRSLPWVAMAASAALVGLLCFMWLSRAPIGYIQDESGALFAEGAGPRDGILERRSYELVSGLIAVELRNGVTMTVKGPAEFDVVDAFRVRLHKGNVRAMAPETGHGFTIETPNADIEDLGTEFGVSVDKESGDSEVHVFDGRVDVKNPGENAAIASLELGESARILKGQINSNGSALPDRFFTPADVSYSRWARASESIRQDEDVVFYYGFNEQIEDDRLLKDEALHGDANDGTITGARWVSGRWPGKRALLFDQQGDSVQIEIPEALPRFTFAAWVKLDRMDEPLTAILNSMGWKEGSLHLQISRSRESFVPRAFPRPVRKKSSVRVPTGQWSLLVAVVDVEARTARTWINGELTIDGYMAEVPIIDPGTCFLGEYRESIDGARSRGFRGRMDEVVLLRRAMSEKEIRKMYNRGRPHSKALRDT